MSLSALLRKYNGQGGIYSLAMRLCPCRALQAAASVQELRPPIMSHSIILFQGVLLIFHFFIGMRMHAGNTCLVL